MFYCFLNNKTFFANKTIFSGIVRKLANNRVILNLSSILIDFEEIACEHSNNISNTNY